MTREHGLVLALALALPLLVLRVVVGMVLVIPATLVCSVAGAGPRWEQAILDIWVWPLNRFKWQ